MNETTNQTSAMNDPAMVPFAAYEAVGARAERSQKRLMLVIISLAVVILAEAVLLYLNNQAWLEKWSEYDYSSETITVDGDDGSANFIGRDGSIINGEDNR